MYNKMSSPSRKRYPFHMFWESYESLYGDPPFDEEEFWQHVAVICSIKLYWRTRDLPGR